MQKTNDLLNSVVFDLSNPDIMKQQFVKYCASKGIKINQDKTLAVFTAYVNAVAVGNANINFNFPDGSFGVTNGGLAGSTYPDSEHMLILGVKMLSGVNASLPATAWVQGVTDAATLNGRIAINNNGTIVLKDLPVTRFPASTNNADLDGGFVALDVPLFWVGQTTLFVNALFPTATAVANSNLRVELIGLKLI